MGQTCTAFAQDGGDYGAQQANDRFKPANNAGVVVEPNYLALHDAVGPSGVPLGGIGVGAVDLAPDGHFTRIAINNWATDGGVARARDEHPEWDAEAFLALWEKDASGHAVSVRLQRDQHNSAGMGGYRHSTYRGLFPTARVAFDDPVSADPHSLASVFAYSGLVPQNVKDSSLPGFWIEVTLANSDSKPVEASVALSWPDLIGRGVYDVAPGDEKTGYDRAFPVEKLVPMPGLSTQVEALHEGTMSGLRQYTTTVPAIRQATFQNYIDAVGLLAEIPQGGSISVLPAWSGRNADAWKSFRENGAFQSMGVAADLDKNAEASSASVVAIKARIAAGGKQTFRFLVTWSIPPMSHATVQFGNSDYGRYFQNDFRNFSSLMGYEISQRQRILEQTSAWQEPILDSTLPEWLQFKLINSGYTMYTNTMLNKHGDFSVMEGGMGGLAGTMDQRMVAHPFYQKFFTPLDRAELQRYADTQDTDGGILHFDASYFVGIADADGHTPVPHEKMIDNTGAWVIQLAKDYQQTGDDTFIRKNAEHIRRGFAYMKAQIRDGSFIPVGGQTFDDYPHPDISIYTGTVYLAALRAGAVLGRGIGDAQLSHECDEQFRKTQRGLINALWNGKFFAYGTDVGGGRRRDDRLFSGQLAGQFISRYAGWGDVLPISESQSAISELLRTSVRNSPDFYAPKVWDMDMQRGVDMPGSRTWPFYLESYTAMPAIQLGYLTDGLDIMRHIQLVHLRNGWTWSQNLWNPAELTYVAAPVTWFSPEVLSNASLDLTQGRLTLGPTLLPGQSRTVIPLYFPRFWATLEYAPSEGKVLLHIIRRFDDRPMVLRQIVIEPIGTASDEAVTVSIPSFAVKAGATLDLSSHLQAFDKRRIQTAILEPDVATH
ncbi:GH116 family glycosyl-hydrolase [Rhodanobacter sp. L36]|uniref:GH116 family glycosyl-hydrolase n=1 Tax=Rhodanobacter sp. L36 TaxID=1747221 RepID=UPI00131D7E1D|nr:GH116 family glycosyl-hydrolase [Rhodanobacter sp. L36]